MKIVVIGGTGLIGSKVVEKLKAKGHETVAAAPNTGVNTVTGEGLAEALRSAQVVVDVANSPSFEDQAAMDFFQAAGKNIVTAEVAAGVKHHVALSVVGTERLQGSGYFRAKLVQEAKIKSSPVPYTLVRATQFFEFLRAIAEAGAEGNTVRISHSLSSPWRPKTSRARSPRQHWRRRRTARWRWAVPRLSISMNWSARFSPTTRIREGRDVRRCAPLRPQDQRQVARSGGERAARDDQVRLVAHPRAAAGEKGGRLTA